MQSKSVARPGWLAAVALLALLVLTFAGGLPVLAQGGEGQPEIVNIPGTLQTELGCPGQWAPDCEATFLEYDEASGLWARTFELPAGEYEYKIAINGSWDENYGGASDPNGPNIILNVPQDMPVTFIYNHATHLVVDNVRWTLGTVLGDFQTALGCEAANDPTCIATLMTDPQRTGVLSFGTYAIPVGEWTANVALGLAGEGVLAEPVAFSVTEESAGVLFEYDVEAGTLTITTVAPGAPFVPPGNLAELRARWVAADTLAWDVPVEDGYVYALHYALQGGMRPGFTGVEGADGSIPLTVDPAGLDEAILARFPHVAGQTALKIADEDLAQVPEALKGQLAVSVSDADGNLLDTTGVQIPGVLDDLYYTDAPLGLHFVDGAPVLSVWAPTAQDVALLLFADSGRNTEPERFAMTRDDSNGVWSVTGTPDWMGKYYLYEVTVYAPSVGEVVVNQVTDPYSVSLSTNSTRSQIIDLKDPALMPEGWQTTQSPPLEAPEDIVLYELHVRDFSARDASVPEALRGTFKAFTLEDTNGVNHLEALAEAGLTHIHLLPSFDIATINENKRAWTRFELDYEAMAALPPDSDQQQAMLEPVRDLDPYNWGYDPYHFNVPEGSYATDPEGAVRVLEFREMVQALHEKGLRVVMDVVYNHTNAAGQASKSVFDRIVPGYYHRLDDVGRITTSTCCQNTATEHAMMERFMVDSVVLWATQYHVDGFRFDLMGHHMRDNMLKVRAALDGLTSEQDGVDGRSVYIYGEGWNFGEVANNARGVNATQLNMGGTGIGTFNDRIRDSIRGGSPFGQRLEQGFINGLYTDPNGFTPGTEAEQLQRLLLFADRIRVGLAGNLRDYTFEGASGEQITGADVDYNGSPTGYTLDPQEQIAYASAHDNETLFDIIQYKAPRDATVDERVRMQNLGLDIVMFSQGVPFFHAGSDMLRSKSLDRDSFNSGDWFNYLDFSYETNNWGVGLPPASHNQNEWPIMQPLLAQEGITPAREDILKTVQHFREILQIRRSTPLFRLRTGAEVMARVQFHNTGPDQVPGLIVMSISDLTAEDLDPAHELVVVVFNVTPEPITYTVSDLAGMGLVLHPVQAASVDPVVQGAAFDAASGTFSVPARTTAVFVLPE
ncbi:MAG: pullulanase-type alpha-1,6-glucosidase [Anaerolineae bacterium]